MHISTDLVPTSGGPLTDVRTPRMEGCNGCWVEAQRADKVALLLLKVRTELDDYFKGITDVLRQVESASRLLRDLWDLFPIYENRIPLILYYLNVILPTLCKTMRDMVIYVDNPALPPRRQWLLMNEYLGDQDGMTLAERFSMYCDALVQTVRLLSRSPLYDSTSMELLRVKHMRLRKLQGIPDPPRMSILSHRAPPHPTYEELEKKNRHWAEKIFNDQPHSNTRLKHTRSSKCFGYPMVEARLGVPQGSTVLFKMPFDKNRLSVTLYIPAEGADATRMRCRWMDRFFNPQHACYGVHELCVRREGSSLQFRRWDPTRFHSKIWLALFFKSWERMVLFHSAFVALKARSPLTFAPYPEDYALAGEEVLFKAQIIDDGYEHSLSVIQDKRCHGLRLHAAVWNGELKKCPVWTAFVTYQSASPQWIHRSRRSRHRVYLKDITPYVFCSSYNKKRQMTKSGEFEIYFVDKHAAESFEEVFREESDHGSIIEVSPPPGEQGK